MTDAEKELIELALGRTMTDAEKELIELALAHPNAADSEAFERARLKVASERVSQELLDETKAALWESLRAERKYHALAKGIPKSMLLGQGMLAWQWTSEFQATHGDEGG